MTGTYLQMLGQNIRLPHENDGKFRLRYLSLETLNSEPGL